MQVAGTQADCYGTPIPSLTSLLIVSKHLVKAASVASPGENPVPCDWDFGSLLATETLGLTAGMLREKGDSIKRLYILLLLCL